MFLRTFVVWEDKAKDTIAFALYSPHSITVYTQHSTCTFHVVSVICSRLVSSGKVTARILDPSLMYSEKEDFEYLSGSSFGSRSRSGTDTLVRDVQDRETDAMMELRSIL